MTKNHDALSGDPGPLDSTDTKLISRPFCCLLCGGAKSKPWLSSCKDYFLNSRLVVDYRVCLSCNLVQQSPTPEDYASLYVNYPVHQQRSRAQVLARKLLHAQVYFKSAGDHSNSTMLDYGCGDGVYLREQRGNYGTVIGFEPDVNHSLRLEQADNIKVYSDCASLRVDHMGKIDVITAHFVIEHLVELHNSFALFCDLLKPGGSLHISVPNIRSWEARLFKRKWHGLDPPRHISFPDLAAFTRLALDHGFEPPQKRYAIFPNTLAASIVTALTGGYHGALFQLLILPSWLVAALAPSGTEVFTLKKAKTKA